MNARSLERNNAPPGSPTVDGAEAQRFPAGEPWIEEDGVVFLLGGQCADCGKRAFPRFWICDACHSERIDEIRLSRTGTVYASTTVHVAPAGFEAPYVLAYVDLAEGVRVLGQVHGADGAIEIGAPLEVHLGVVRRHEDGRPVISYVFQRGGAS